MNLRNRNKSTHQQKGGGVALGVGGFDEESMAKIVREVSGNVRIDRLAIRPEAPLSSGCAFGVMEYIILKNVVSLRITHIQAFVSFFLKNDHSDTIELISYSLTKTSI